MKNLKRILCLALVLFVVSGAMVGCKEEQIEEQPPHVHEYEKGFCECGDIDLEYTTEGVVMELVGDAYYKVTDYTGSEKRVLIGENYNGKAVKEIGDGAFSSQIYMRYVNLPSTIETIGEKAFFACMALKNINIPEKTSKIGKKAFAECTAITQIDYRAKDIESEERLYLFDNVGTQGEGISLTIGNAVERLPDYLFYPEKTEDGKYNRPNIVSVKFEDNSACKEIGETVFYGIRPLKTVDFGQNSVLESIGNSAFGACVSVESIDLPATVKYIGRYAFGSMTKLNTFTLGATDGWTAVIKVGNEEERIEIKNLSEYLKGSSDFNNIKIDDETKLVDIAFTDFSSAQTNALLFKHLGKISWERE